MQKKILKFLLLAALLAYPLKISSQTVELPAVVITEIGAFEPSDTEWIEIYNRSVTTADLTDWKFFEDATNHKLTSARGDMVLEPAEFAVIASKADLFIQKYPEYTGTVFDSSWGSLKEDGEEIGLKDASGNFIELFTYPSVTSASLERVDVNLPANDLANWASHPTSHSLGKLREMLAPANSEPPSEPQAESPSEPQAEPQPEIIAPLSEPPPLSISNPQSPISSTIPPSIPPSRVYVPSPPKPPTAPPPSSPLPSSNIPYSPFHIPEQAIFHLRGYFIFVPYDAPAAPPEKKKASASPLKTPKTAAKTPAKKTPKTKQKKPAKTAAFQNGGLSNLVKITEILPNPEQGEEEWVEIFNGDSRPVNLGNWSLSDASKKSPRPIPDSATLTPKAYAIFPKSETKLSLNNEGDEIFLRDFEGKIMDSVSYERSKPGKSYALVAIEKNSDLVASREWFSPRPANKKSSWEWIDEPTPGKPNPAFSKIEGTVSRLLAGGEMGGEPTFDVTLSNGASKKIRFTPETLDPLMAEVVLKEGTSVSLQAQKSGKDVYDLKKIEEVAPAEQDAAPESQTREEKEKTWWIIGTLIGVGMMLSIIPLIRALLRKFR